MEHLTYKQAATIKRRLCEFNKAKKGACDNCELHDLCGRFTILEYIDEIESILIKWNSEHKKTRQNEFLKLFPNARLTSDGVVDIRPCRIDAKNYEPMCEYCEIFKGGICNTSEYWLKEID